MVNALGILGEDIAVAHLLGLGWHVVARNWRCPLGEVDVVAVDDTGALVFVEVKCRAGTSFGHPLEAITAEKAARLRRLASFWLRHERSVAARQVRIDALGIVKRRGWAPNITHLRGIA